MARGISKLGLAVLLVTVLAGCQGLSGGKSPGRKIMLWNGTDFSGWRRFVSDPAVNVDDVWRIRDGILRCKGQPNGYIRTEKRYRNYQLHLDWRWPETPTNSGVLLHGRSPDRVWPACIECQLKAGDAGDLVLIDGAGLTVHGVKYRNPDKQFNIIGKKSPTSERPAGQWNSLLIRCKGRSIRCFVNGVLQNEGTRATVDSGWIALQSEGSPIEFRDIYLLPAN